MTPAIGAMRAFAEALFGLAVTLALAGGPAEASEWRCGWIHNPTPANWWLFDRDGEWTIGTQGGYQAPGLTLIPDLTQSEWVVTNRPTYGYGCGCAEVDVDRGTWQVSRIYGFSRRPLAVCRADPALPKPD